MDRKKSRRKMDPYVFYTDYGSVYHLSEQCNYLDLSIKSINGHRWGQAETKMVGNTTHVTVPRIKNRRFNGIYNRLWHELSRKAWMQ